MLETIPRHLRKSLMKHLVTEQLGFAIQGFPIFFKMDSELRATFLLLLRPVLLGDQDFLFEALDVGREGHKENETCDGKQMKENDTLEILTFIGNITCVLCSIYSCEWPSRSEKICESVRTYGIR